MFSFRQTSQQNKIMEVKTYEVEEVTGEMGIMAADSEAIELCQKYGLVGQQRLANGETATRVPYREITMEEKNIFEACFPNKTKLENYSGGIIPLRVLQVVAHCKESKLFDEYYVWHPNPGQTDPVLVGHRKMRPEGWSFDTTVVFLLARWGDSLESLEVLREKAKKILAAKWGSKLQIVQAEASQSSATLDARISEHLHGIKQYNDPYFNW